jgi:hypothetical protein
VPPGTSSDELRRLVLDLIAQGRHRTFPALVHVGRPGRHRSLVVADIDDHALRTDVLAALIGSADEAPLVWLTRPGEPAIEDDDQAWSRAVRAAAAEVGRSTPFVVVTRRGWVDPAHGHGRTWRRLRDRRPR